MTKRDNLIEILNKFSNIVLDWTNGEIAGHPNMLTNHAADEIEALDDWIPVSEGLPELGAEVDLWKDGRRITNCWLDHYDPQDHRLFWYKRSGNDPFFTGGMVNDFDNWPIGNELWKPINPPKEGE